MSNDQQREKRSIFSRLPSFVWVLIFVGGTIGLIGGMIALFVGLSSVEGLASVLLVVIAWIVIRAGSGMSSAGLNKVPGASLITGLGITFFAAMGLAVDQPGNYLYNRPLEWFFCPQDSVLSRGVDVSHPRAGTTQISQDFECVEPSDKTLIRQIGVGEVILVRFVEYVLIGYALIALSRLYSRLRPRQPRST